MRHAIDTYLKEQLKPAGIKQESYREVTDEHNVSKSTLQHLVQGRKSMSAFNAGKQKLTPEEEQVVVDFWLDLQTRAFHSHTNVYAAADKILTTRLGDDHDPLGQNWVDNFLS